MKNQRTLSSHRFAAITLFITLMLCVENIPAQNDVLTSAHSLFLSGRYAESLVATESLEQAHPLAMILLRHDIAVIRGQPEAALAALNAALKIAPEDRQLFLRAANYWLEQRDIRQTKLNLESLIRRFPANPAERWLLVQCYLEQGRFREACNNLRWFAEKPWDASQLDADSALALATGLVQHAAWNHESKWYDFAVNTVLAEASRMHPHDARIPLLRARIFAEQSNEPAAVDALNIALAKNAALPTAHLLRAELALAKFDIPAMRLAYQQAKRVNPHSVELVCLEADGYFAELNAAQAAEVLEAAVKKHGERAELIGRLWIALEATQGTHIPMIETRAETLRREVRAKRAAGATAFVAAGQACELLRRIGQAEEMYRTAFELAPELPGVRFSWASQLLRLNQNERVAELLQAAALEDPFNVRLKNTLAVLDVLRNYAQLETEHFVIRFDRAHDELLAKYAAAYLESEVYPPLVQRFGFAPRDKAVIELFNRTGKTSGHGWFSARMVGLPGLHTIGACSGKVVALASPTDMPQPYNWARVLRHEFVHRLNLEQTGFRVPHWVTEGLAVDAEGRPRSGDWTRLITQRYHENKLFNLHDINFGFIRPATSREWTLAYAQAQLYIEYLRNTFGPDSLPKLLTAYANNASTEEAISTAAGIALPEFEEGYRKFLAEQITLWNLQHAVGSQDVVQLQSDLAKNPGHVQRRAELAAAHLAKNELVLAKHQALESLRLDTKCQTAAWVLATLSLQSGELEEAERIAQEALAIERPHPDLLSLLATRKFAKKQFGLAEKLSLVGKKQFPTLEIWNELLVNIYSTQKDDAKLRLVLEGFVEQHEDDIVPLLKLMQFAWQEKNYVATQFWCQRILYIDVRHAAAHAHLGMTLVSQGQPAASLPEFAAALAQGPLLPEWKLAYAQALVATNNKPQARALVEEMIRSSPDLPGLLELAREVEP